jgi:hypothetical protein
MVAPFVRQCPEYRDYRGRGRVVALFFLRAGLFLLLTRDGDRGFALLAYLMSYSLMLQVLRFGDAFQHTYDTVLSDPKTGKAKDEEDKKLDRVAELANTFSNLVLANHTRMNEPPSSKHFFQHFTNFFVGWLCAAFPPLDPEKRLDGVEQQQSAVWPWRLGADVCNLLLHLNFGYVRTFAHFPRLCPLPRLGPFFLCVWI